MEYNITGFSNSAAIAEIISDYPDIPLVLDPVMSSGRGDMLMDSEAIAAMIELLLPQTTLITPNSLEARRLALFDAEADDDDEEDCGGESAATGSALSLPACARRLIQAGCEYVLVTGTHENTPQVINTLYAQRGVVRTDYWERLRATPTLD